MEQMKNRLKREMSPSKVIEVMGDENHRALSCIAKMFLIVSADVVWENMYLLDSLGIYGEKLYILWHNCCGSNILKFQATMEVFKTGTITETEIHENLSSILVEPFV